MWIHEALKGLAETLGVDYVVESGTKSNWTYQKWKSGKVEAWRTFTGSLTIQTAVGSLYQTASTGTISIPSGLVSSIDYASVNIAHPSWGVIPTLYGATATTLSYRALSLSSRASSNYTISAHFIGKV